MHVLDINDETGDLVDYLPMCSDACHRTYCEQNTLDYAGWTGCHDGGDSPEFCAQCGVYCGGEAECEHQTYNVVVNRFLCPDGEKCECGHWIQLPTPRLPNNATLTIALPSVAELAADTLSRAALLEAAREGQELGEDDGL